MISKNYLLYAHIFYLTLLTKGHELYDLNYHQLDVNKNLQQSLENMNNIIKVDPIFTNFNEHDNRSVNEIQNNFSNQMNFWTDFEDLNNIEKIQQQEPSIFKQLQLSFGRDTRSRQSELRQSRNSSFLQRSNNSFLKIPEIRYVGLRSRKQKFKKNKKSLFLKSTKSRQRKSRPRKKK